MEINRNTIIKDIVKKHPETLAVFRKYNLVVAGGVRGPNEPLAFFSKAHEVDYDEIARELKEAIEKGVDDSTEVVELKEDKVYEKFLKAAILMTLTIGVTFGAALLTHIGMKKDFQTGFHSIVQVHGHAQLFGWVGLCIIGFAYYIVPRVKNTELNHSELTTTSFWLMIIGNILRIVAQPFSNETINVILPISGLLECAAILTFAFIIFSTVLASKEKSEVYDKFIMAGVIWFLLSGFMNFFMDVYLFFTNTHEIPSAVYSPFVHVFLLGFVFMFIFAVNIRTVYAFLDVRTIRVSAVNITFWLLNITIPVYFVSNSLIYRFPSLLKISYLATYLVAFSLLLFVFGIRVFEKSTKELDDIVMDRSYAKTIRAAYVWLIVGVLILGAKTFFRPFSEQQYLFHGAANHALTVGFVTMMIMGYASKMIPTFKGINMSSLCLSNLSFVLLNLGCFLRVSTQVMIGFKGEFYYSIIGISGWIELVAIGMFGYNVWRTMNAEEGVEEVPGGSLSQITKNTKISDVVDQYPETLEVFLQFGFKQLSNPVARRTIAKMFTVEQATKIHPVQIDDLLNALNERIKKI
ncbi:MAG: DUF1858 domain-containing protein [Candidatus Scalindua sp. AMX11]|nr:MAG: DUF1858 domain-containing protein [Candidatus Scalindua sp.]NOG83942.1 DUF1858 domain-containing protein [Planctomycetota bacterium]RZV88013.1 MAG: DUF1858 domain-containing protein [Candidatus Scalindua sp. SCAELEC01]TDE64161.1 MAG: DUF1858 domain-containing protein [Candidatus Scalindua sp. AMX11]GJQ58409.1 MAG: hypothetical protein SCALA701_12100 [Candidatus Scalindua sp.]